MESVSSLSSKKVGCGVLFKAGATLLDADNKVMGYALEPKAWSELHPQVCSMVSGDVRR